jgi:hypothetical protein
VSETKQSEQSFKQAVHVDDSHVISCLEPKESEQMYLFLFLTKKRRMLMTAEFIGLDAEWRPDARWRTKAVAVLQMATGSACAVVHLIAMAQNSASDAPLPDTLLGLLRSERWASLGPYRISKSMYTGAEAKGETDMVGNVADGQLVGCAGP